MAVELCRLTRCAHGLRAVEQAQAPQVLVVQAARCVAAVMGFSGFTQAARIEARNQDGAARILEEAAVFLHHRRAFATAHAEDQQGYRALLQRLLDAAALLFREGAGDQQQATLAQLRLVEQLQCTGHSQIGATPRLRHQRGFQRFEQVAAGGQVV